MVVPGGQAVLRIDQASGLDLVQAHAEALERAQEPLLDHCQAAADAERADVLRDGLDEAERSQEAPDHDPLNGLDHNPGDLDPLGDGRLPDRRGQLELEGLLRGEPEPGARFSEDQPRASQEEALVSSSP